ncbi:uncharacterized protein A1O9_12119 [Exophiala aquamarina CBS 119918]|uniref:VOC domain-containing protein n=1 Tax=Exophiala aquamarina CBS 119918 TaxID=1182545 RepID=A0A072NWK7_9EURO|nr:uncharacterized protein A1O9_12119 [Exophiala aquamarina CBS 119918]KEF51782.1 hypothetical protein A1O9_12119 [Exophiala aquamarina CBS 119918]
MPSSITLTVSHLPTSTSFFLSALQPLNYVFRGRQENTIGFGPESPPNTPPDFWITQEIPGVPAGAAHVAFPALSRSHVQAFFLAALKAGGKIHGEPAQRDASGYYSAAVIDFDGNSIEAVYRPGLADDNKENEDVRSTVSRRTAAQSVVKAPSAVGRPKTVVSAREPTVVSQARSNAPSQARSVVAPSHVSAVPPAQIPPATEPKSKPQGDVLDTLINEARNAASVARNLVNTVRPSLVSSNSSPPAANTGSNGNSTGLGAGDAIVGTLLGVAAGAALHYAFSNRSKESAAADEVKPEAQRPSVVGRSVTEPNMRGPEYSAASGASATYYEGDRVYRAIEPAPSAYTYNTKSHYEGPKMITMYDKDPAKSEYASTIKAANQAVTNVSRRTSIDSGFGPGPRDLELVSTATSKASRQSKKSTKALEAPPTSYRAPTVLTTAETQVSKAKSRAGSKSRSGSLSRVMSLARGRDSDGEKHSQAASATRPRSHSRHSRRSRKDDFDDEEAQTVLHVTESVHRTKSYHKSSEHHSHSHAGSKAPSRSGPQDYPLPPSRAATWAGSENGSFVSARSGIGPTRNSAAARTVIGKLTPRNLKNNTVYQDFAENGGTESVIGKHKDVAKLQVTDTEVRPEDSVSQISVDSRASRRSKVTAVRR